MDVQLRAMTNGSAPVLNVDNAFRALYVGVAGDITVVGLASDGRSAGNTVTYTNVPVGVHAIGGLRIVSATTTATIAAVQLMSD
jgi:hypothetical protein